MKGLIVAGFVFAGVGFIIGGVFGEREVGALAFILGFVTAAAGMVGRILTMRFPDEMKVASRGIKIGTMGFVVIAIALLSEFVIPNRAANVFFYVGIIVVVTGIISSVVAVNRRL